MRHFEFLLLTAPSCICMFMCLGSAGNGHVFKMTKPALFFDLYRRIAISTENRFASSLKRIKSTLPVQWFNADSPNGPNTAMLAICSLKNFNMMRTVNLLIQTVIGFDVCTLAAYICLYLCSGKICIIFIPMLISKLISILIESFTHFEHYHHSNHNIDSLSHYRCIKFVCKLLSSIYRMSYKIS